LEKQPPRLLVDVAGVGYEVEAPMTVFYNLPESGAELTLYTHFVVREDAQLLYGFTGRYERELFRSLIKVNGVGPKMALAILSGIEADRLAACIRDQDTTSLVKVPGIGKKTCPTGSTSWKARRPRGPGRCPWTARRTAAPTPSPRWNRSATVIRKPPPPWAAPPKRPAPTPAVKS